MPISTETDAAVISRSVVAVTGDYSDGQTSTGEGTDGRSSTRAIDSDGGATSGTERNSSRLISEEGSADIVGRGPRTGASPTRVMDSSERPSETLEDSTSLMRARGIGTATAESGEQEADQQGRVRTRVEWGQGIPLRPARTIRRIPQTAHSRADNSTQTTSRITGIESNILSGILPGHASVTDAVTRLQRERDLALRRIDELHEHHKKELKSKADADHRMSQWHKISIRISYG